MPKAHPRVTDLELMILQRIWEAGDSQTVNQIIDTWPERKKPGYTTILKTLQKMEAKGVVGHDEDGRRYTYFPTIEHESIAETRLQTIIDRMFGGSKVSFARYFIDSSELSVEELEEVKRLVARRAKEESK